MKEFFTPFRYGRRKKSMEDTVRLLSTENAIFENAIFENAILTKHNNKMAFWSHKYFDSVFKILQIYHKHKKYFQRQKKKN